MSQPKNHSQKFNFGDLVRHPDYANESFTVVGIRPDETEIKGDWSGVGHADSPAWVKTSLLKHLVFEDQPGWVEVERDYLKSGENRKMVYTSAGLTATVTWTNHWILPRLYCHQLNLDRALDDTYPLREATEQLLRAIRPLETARQELRRVFQNLYVESITPPTPPSDETKAPESAPPAAGV